MVPAKTPQDLIYDHFLNTTPLDEGGCLLDALLWRGFLAFRDEHGIWLGKGSHVADIEVLRLIESLEVNVIDEDSTRAAAVRYRGNDLFDVAKKIIFLPQHQGFSRFGLGGWNQKSGWVQYRSMRWGAKKAVCPAVKLDSEYVYDALDIGVALLVKALPLIRVATALSCDGHMARSAHVSLYYPWDTIWAEMVLNAIGTQTPNSDWNWNASDNSYSLTISPRYKGAWRETYIDIQNVARQLLNQHLIDVIGQARERILNTLLGRETVSLSEFRGAAKSVKADIELAARTVSAGAIIPH